MWAGMSKMSFKKEELHLIHKNINSLFPITESSALFCEYNQCVYFWNEWD